MYSNPILDQIEPNKTQNFIENDQLELFDNCTLKLNEIPLENQEKGITLYTLSDKVTPQFFSYSLITFYVSVIYVIGGFLRKAVYPPTEKFFITEMPNSEKMLQLCEGIVLSRLSKNIVQEEILFFVLMDAI